MDTIETDGKIPESLMKSRVMSWNIEFREEATKISTRCQTLNALGLNLSHSGIFVNVPRIARKGLQLQENLKSCLMVCV